MPDASGKLNEGDQIRVRDWLLKKAPSGFVCSVCKANDWVIGDHVVAAPTHGEGLILGGPTYPNVFVVCRNCGHTLYINAVVSGVLSNQPARPQVDDQPSST